MSETNTTTTKTKEREPHPFIHFSDIINQIEKDRTKGVIPYVTDAEPRISDLSYLQEMQKQIEKKEKYKDRLAGPLVSLGEGWGLLFPQ